MTRPLPLLILLALAPPRLIQAQAGASVTQKQILDRVEKNERALIALLSRHNPLAETYIQVLSPSSVDRIEKDYYFLGRLNLLDEPNYESLIGQTDSNRSLLSRFREREFAFVPRGFAQMALADNGSFDRNSYIFEFVRREFLGDVRCLVFDVRPAGPDRGKFTGRIWVEDAGFQVVRLNGKYSEGAEKKRSRNVEHYFHFDSWRVNVQPGVWVPAQIYVEETGHSPASPRGRRSPPQFRAQTRFWGYAPRAASKLEEMTSIVVANDVPDHVERPTDPTPLERQRTWQRQAEGNVIQRLERGSLIAPPGEIDGILNAVVNNLLASNQLAIDVKCRVLLTTPLESFSVGNTIVVSRGLIDVLPDESSLAVVLAGELAHISLGHRSATQFAFQDQVMTSDAEILRRFRFSRSEEEIREAGMRGLEIIQRSPYKNLAAAGLFLKALGARSQTLPALIQPNLGNRLGAVEIAARWTALVEKSPPLREQQIDQIAALPLGSRIKLDPWENRTALLPNKPLALLSPSEKMPFEIAPLFLNLTRFEPPPASIASGANP